MSQMLHTRFGLHYRVIDVMSILGALYLSFVLRSVLNVGKAAATEVLEIWLVLFLAAAVIWQIVFDVFGIYTGTPRRLSVLAVSRLGEAHALATLTFLGVLYVVYRDFSRLESFYFITILFVLLAGYRFAWHILHSTLGISLHRKRNVLIVGVGAYAHEIGRIITDYASLGLSLVGYIPHSCEDVFDSNQVLGSLDELAEIVVKYAIDEVIVCDRSNKRSDLKEIYDTLVNLPVNLRIAPDYSEMAYFHVAVEDFASIPLLSLRYDMLTSSQRLLKRIFDLIGASLLLLMSLPLSMLIYLAIKLDSPGPAFFQQIRVGERGRLFPMYKFRTMVWGAESKITYSSNYKTPDDPRITRVGQWLRRTSLDEIPQLLNVLKGEMSLIGPVPNSPRLSRCILPGNANDLKFRRASPDGGRSMGAPTTDVRKRGLRRVLHSQLFCLARPANFAAYAYRHSARTRRLLVNA